MAREQINQMGRNNKVVLHNELKTNQNDVYYRLTSELSSLLKKGTTVLLAGILCSVIPQFH